MDTSEDTNTENIDEGLYSRQLYVMDHKSQQLLSNCQVLILGLDGLGVEVAKNIILAGVKSVTICDDTVTKISDLGSQFYLNQNHVGKLSRAEASMNSLRLINSYVSIKLHKGPITNQLLSQYQVVVETQPFSLKKLLHLNAQCRKLGVKFCYSSVSGLAGTLWNDFGDNFSIRDTDGEQPKVSHIINIESNGTVHVTQKKFHDLQDGDWVEFTEVLGMDEINKTSTSKHFVISKCTPHSFNIGDLSKFSPYTGGGIVTQIKQGSRMSFQSLDTALEDPKIFEWSGSFTNNNLLHHCFIQLLQFQDDFGHKPNSLSEEKTLYSRIIDCISKSSLSSTSTSLSNGSTSKNEIDQNTDLMIKTFCRTTGTVLNPIAVLFGGIIGQEVLKACSSKFTPMRDFFYFDSSSILFNQTISKTTPTHSRYDDQIKVFGADFTAKLRGQRWFLVGCGAIGCELLKNFVLMGIGSLHKGQIRVTDLDAIERSNLNRQFLFHPEDVGKLKSIVGGTRAKIINPDCSIKAYSNPVGPNTEDIFSDNFFSKLDGVANALDNVEARHYMDSRCVYYDLPLLESGTLGTKGNVQCIIPHLTESYSNSHDPPQSSFPSCTVKHFPFQIEHTLVWAKNQFYSRFDEWPSMAIKYLEDRSNFFDEIEKIPATRTQFIKLVSSLLTTNPGNFDDCIALAFKYFNDTFNFMIQDLIHDFPHDFKTGEGLPFWAPPKRFPTPIQFDASNPIHFQLVNSAAHLIAYQYGIKPHSDKQKVISTISKLVVPKFIPKAQSKTFRIDKDGNEQVIEDTLNPDAEEEEYQSLKKNIPILNSSFVMKRNEFEKDDDTNFHMDFIHACANLRALNYKIPIVSRHKAKGIAGNIMPAIATTTAAVTGLVCLELYKYVFGHTTYSDQNQLKSTVYRSAFLNLALPFFSQAEPLFAETIPAEWKKPTKDDPNPVQTEWTKIDIIGPKTLRGVLQYFDKQLGLRVDAITIGSALVYMSWSPKPDRLPMTIPQLYHTVKQEHLPEKQRWVPLNISAVSKVTDEDVELPLVRLKLSKRSSSKSPFTSPMKT